MIRRNTWILLALLLALVGFSIYLREQKTQQEAQATPTAGESKLFTSPNGSPTDIRIESNIGTVVRVSRDQNGKWVLKEPAQADADQASAEAAAAQIGALRVLAEVQLAADIIGLDKPEFTLTIAYGSDTRRLLVGSITPIQNGYYVQLDDGRKQIVDKVGLDALLGLLDKPPYLATVTPLVSATPSALPSPATPEGTNSPSGMPEAVTATNTP